jgi:hypothetical protein
MPVPSKITDLSPNEALNSPQGTENVGSPGSVDNYFRAIQAIIRQESLIKSWEVQSDVVTYISANSFSVPGDKTAVYAVGRRVQANGATIVYGSIASSSFNGVITTVVLTLDAGALDPTLASVYLGINPVAAQHHFDSPISGPEADFDVFRGGVFSPSVVIANWVGPQVINFSASQAQRITIQGPITITDIINFPGGSKMYFVFFATDLGTITWPAIPLYFNWPMGVVPNLAAGPRKIATVEIINGGGEYFAVAQAY